VGDGELQRLYELGLSERVEDDADTIGYRRCASEQVVTTQIICRLRELDMPLDDIRAVLDASDVENRNRVIADHLGRLESNLARTQAAARALRDLLNRGPQGKPEIEHRSMPAASSMGETKDGH
jgi:DNA-binding transcriptional MerR regulator